MIGGRNPFDEQMRKLFKHVNQQDAQIDALRKELARQSALPRYVPNTEKNDVDDLRKDELHYANVITLLGYGGFFALWSACAGRLTALSFALIGLAMGLSLLAFVGFELLKTVCAAQVHNRAAQKNPEGHRVMSDREYLKQLRDSTDWVNGKWLYFFVPSVVLGIGAGISLLIGFIDIARKSGGFCS